MDDLQQAQSALGRSVRKARAGEDRELAQRVREGGETLAHMLGGLLKMSRVHAADNRAFDAPVAEFTRALETLHGLIGTVHLVAVQDQAYVNDVRMRTERAGGARDLGAELRRHNVGGLSFQAPLAAPAVRALVGAFAGAPVEPHPRTALRARLVAAGMEDVELHGIFRFRVTGDTQAGVDPGEAMRRAMRLSQEAWRALGAGRAFNPLGLRRAVAEIVECGALAPRLWDAWVTQLPRHEHALAATLHALLLGEAVGVGSAALQDLGVAGMLHDVGYVAMQGGIAAAGADGLARHPGEGARALLRQRGFSEAKVRRLRAVLDHHRAAGDPAGPPSLFGAILRIAEDYTNFLRLHGARVSATDVLGAMVRSGAAHYPPALLQLFVNALGRHPPGTLLELAGGQRVRSVSPARDRQRFATPLARPVDGQGAPVGEPIDLATGPAIVRALPG